MTYDHWKTTEPPDDGAEPPDEYVVYTEADMAAAVEAEREACEQIAQAELSGWHSSPGAISRNIAAIAARKRDTQ